MLRDCQFCIPVPPSFYVGLKVGDAVDFGIVGLDVRVEGGGVSRDMNRVGSMEICSAQWYGGRVAYADMEIWRGW